MIIRLQYIFRQINISSNLELEIIVPNLTRLHGGFTWNSRNTTKIQRAISICLLKQKITSTTVFCVMTGSLGSKFRMDKLKDFFILMTLSLTLKVLKKKIWLILKVPKRRSVYQKTTRPPAKIHLPRSNQILVKSQVLKPQIRMIQSLFRLELSRLIGFQLKLDRLSARGRSARVVPSQKTYRKFQETKLNETLNAILNK